MAGGVKKYRPVANIYIRFLSKVDAKNFDADECWLWRGATKGNGYGNVRVAGTNIGAHRLSYELFVGPCENFDVCHTCDTRNCVNPAHLFLGTRAENMTDCKAKGRTAGPNRKHLREGQVQEIRARLSSGHSPRQISNDMKIGYGVITGIRAGRNYASTPKDSASAD